MRIAFAADDSNECVEAVRAYLEKNHDVAVHQAPWPLMSRSVAEAVVAGNADYGVLMCWTGTGTAIAANKVPGARAATVADAWTARGARLWNDANVVALSLKRLAPDVAVECVTAFLSEPTPDPEEAANIAGIEKAARGQ
ncbi:RpiB/LacA/LacB family sugar-phosphate isomerase [Cryptosporangium sp. NPDC048952]|uniref:RpiB/LacA/LacB family sugar-phosphate isomerase n=1 Tax=Cryptosporangium sp. NPDC048952 TaxID=3363961 RepID=UPI00371C50FA